MAGYSGTPLAKKLGLKPGHIVLVLNAPNDHRAWLGAAAGRASFVAKPPKEGCDLVHLFVASVADLERGLPTARKAIARDGMIWVSWLKKSAKIPTEVSEDRIRALALAADLVDVKVCSVTEIWSALKLVVRKHLR
jgi:hypothetical protein